MYKYAMTIALMALAIPFSQADVTNRGQVVSDCNQRANERDLMGQERQEFVDRCVARHDTSAVPRQGTSGQGTSGQATSADANSERRSDCKARADARRLRDEERRQFVSQCVGSDVRPGQPK